MSSYPSSGTSHMVDGDLFRLSPMAIFITDLQGVFIDANPCALQLTGYSLEDLRAMRIRDLLHPDFMEAGIERFLSALKGSREEGILPLNCSAGSKVWVMASISLYGPDRVIGFCHNVTDLKSSQEKFRMLFESMHEACAIHRIICDDTGKPVDYRFLEVNAAFETITGLNRKDILGKRVLEVLPGTEHWWIDTYGKVALTGESVTIENYSGELGKIFDVSAYSTAPGEFATIFRDITRKVVQAQRDLQQERERQQTQRLENIGRLAGGVAHDFNNLLMTILGNADLAIKNLEPDHPVWESMDHIILASRRASELCRELLAYSGKGRVTPEEVNLSEIIREMVSLLKVSLPQGVVVDTDLQDDIPVFTADATQIRQVVMNLIVNAAEASTSEEAFRPRLVTIRSRYCRDNCFTPGEILEPGLDLEQWNRMSILEHKSENTTGWVCLEVLDRGCGMTREVMNHAFEPFYTTKFAGRGLGLAAVGGIVRSHKGGLSLYTCPGQGTLFRLCFPAMAESQDASPLQNCGGNCSPVGKITGTQPIGDSDHSQTGLALFVDDEESIRELGSRMLTKMGYKCLLATNGQEAVDRLEEHQGKIDCVVMDMLMPVKSGEDALKEFRSKGFDLPVLMISGYCGDEPPEFIRNIERASFLAKPFTLRQMRESLSQLIN